MLISKQSGLIFVADYGFNVFNSEAVEMINWSQNNYSHPTVSVFPLITLSLEASLNQLIEVAREHGPYLECVVHGPVRGMLSEHCVINAQLGNGRPIGSCRDLCRFSPSGNPTDAPIKYGLKDQMGQVFPILVDRHCRNHILLPCDLCALPVLPTLLKSGIAALRINADPYDDDTLGATIGCYKRAIQAVQQGESYNWLNDPAWIEIESCAPRGFSLCSYGNRPQEIAFPSEELPTNAWIIAETDLSIGPLRESHHNSYTIVVI
jgi:putative protease